MTIPYVRGNPLFTDINRVTKQYNYLTNDIETDIVIIGGGVTGAILGYYFSKNNIPTVIIEKNRIAHCSTSITTALLQYELDGNLLNDLIGWYNNVLIRNNKDPYNYFRTTEDNRIIAGGEDIAFIPDIFNEEVANEKYSILLQKVKDMFSDIVNIKLDYAYCGAFDSTQDDLGFMGPDPNEDKLWYCLGYGANGILFAILGGLMLPKLYIGEYDNNLDLFKIGRFDN